MERVAGEEDQGANRPRRVLVAEDSSVTQDLLKLVLGQGGYDVDIAGDGTEALEALRSAAYDVALLDFHMPEMTGLDVVSAFLASEGLTTRPHFVAITGDVKALLGDTGDCEQFDRVLPKPLDIQSVIDTIEELGPAVSKTSEKKAARTKKVHIPSAFEALPYAFLRWPTDTASHRHDLYDAILVTEVIRRSDLHAIWSRAGLHLLPVIDLAGALGRAADVDASQSSPDAARIRDIVEGFGERRARLHDELIHGDEPDDRLLARMYVAKRPLTPAWSGDDRTFVEYDLPLETQTAMNAASRLSERGLVSRAFVDKTHVCSACGSARLNFREICPACGSSDLEEAGYLHHFRCAYQGAEEDFRKGDDLVCPKCRRALRHFGQDYDRPGYFVRCRACGTGSSEPNIGCICTDCGTQAAGDAVETRDVHEYSLTDQGIGYAEAGPAFLGLTQRTLRFADLPLDIVVALNAAAKAFNEAGTPFTLLSISYENERDLIRSEGSRSFGNIRAQFLENLKQYAGDGARALPGRGYDYALLPGRSLSSEDMQRIAARASRSLAQDPGARIRAFGPEDLV